MKIPSKEEYEEMHSKLSLLEEASSFLRCRPEEVKIALDKLLQKLEDKDREILIQLEYLRKLRERSMFWKVYGKDGQVLAMFENPHHAVGYKKALEKDHEGLWIGIRS
jgi:hypothetical protein